jgi:hypothetical protein
MALIKGNRRFYEMLLGLSVDDVTSESDILAATQWKASAFKTYLPPERCLAPSQEHHSRPRHPPSSAKPAT